MNNSFNLSPCDDKSHPDQNNALGERKKKNLLVPVGQLGHRLIWMSCRWNIYLAESEIWQVLQLRADRSAVLICAHWWVLECLLQVGHMQLQIRGDHRGRPVKMTWPFFNFSVWTCEAVFTWSRLVFFIWWWRNVLFLLLWAEVDEDKFKTSWWNSIWRCIGNLKK